MSAYILDSRDLFSFSLKTLEEHFTFGCTIQYVIIKPVISYIGDTGSAHVLMAQVQITLHVYEIEKSKDQGLKHAFTTLCNFDI